MIYKFKLCLMSLSLLFITSSSIEDFENNNAKAAASRAESREIVDVDLNTKGLANAEGRAKPAGVYVIGNFRTGPRGRPPKNRNKQNQTRRVKPRPNRFQVIQVQSNKKQTNIRLQNGNRNGARRGNKRKNNNNNNKRGGFPNTPKIAGAETIAPPRTFATFAPVPPITTQLMPLLSFDPNFQDIQ